MYLVHVNKYSEWWCVILKPIKEPSNLYLALLLEYILNSRFLN